MDLRLTFNEDPLNYDKFRPTYPSKLTDDVIRFSKLGIDSNALEIGVGTGQATLPFIEAKSQIKGIEIGSDLSTYVSNKFAEYDNFKVVNQDFELIELKQEAFDLVYSASAFHWIPVETGIPKVISILKPEGVFAWFSVQPMPSEEHLHIHKDIQLVYQNYNEYFGDKPVPDPKIRRKQAIQKKEKRCNILERFGFVDITSDLYYDYDSRTYTSDDYVKLISTHSDHRAIPEERRTVFLEAAKKAIDDNGGQFTLSDTFILCMGRKA